MQAPGRAHQSFMAWSGAGRGPGTQRERRSMAGPGRGKSCLVKEAGAENRGSTGERHHGSVRSGHS